MTELNHLTEIFVIEDSCYSPKNEQQEAAVIGQVERLATAVNSHTLTFLEGN